MKQHGQNLKLLKAASAALGIVSVFCLSSFCGPSPRVLAAAPRVAELLDTMTRQYAAGQFVQAGHTGQQILTIDPNNLNAHYLMGNIFLKADVLDSAAREYEWCIAHAAGTKIGSYAKNALDVMEGKIPPPGVAAGATPQTASQARGQGPQMGGQQNLPTQFSNPFNPNQINPNQINPGQTNPGQNSGFNVNANAGLNANYLPPGQFQATGGPSKVQMQAGEYSQRATAQGQAFIEGKRHTMEAAIKRINDDANFEIRGVPKTIQVGRERIPNPDYDSIVQSIKSAAADKVKILQDDFDNEQNKVGTFYKKMADSYDKQPDSALSQTQSTRSHYVIDNNPSMFVRNYGKVSK